MAPPRLLARHDRRVALDHGQFYLFSAAPDPGLMSELLHEALFNDDGIAQRDGLVAVLSPHQNNFDMAFRVEIWTAEPAADLDEWQEAFELHLDVSDYGVQYDSTFGNMIDFGVPPGSYHALVTGRDFVARGWPGSTEPGDKWRIKLFPSQGPPAARRIRAFVEPQFRTPPPQFQKAGIAAVRRLHHALDHRTPLSGRRGTARAGRTIPGTRRVVYKYFEDPSGWLTQASSRDGSGGYWLYGAGGADGPWADVSGIVPTNGEIRCTRIDAQSPAYAEVTWSWYEHGPERERIPIIPATPQMTLRFELTKGPAGADWPTVTVTVIHAHVPEEFLEDLGANWSWILERADYTFDLSNRRMMQAREALRP